ncbi:hypothetical protein Tco_0742160 [Tanacetum coccineum]
MHNNIMAAASKDRPPMLATGIYAQWRSRFLRYIDIKNNGEALRKCILEGPYMPTTVVVQAVEAADDSPAILQHTAIETVSNMDEIYSTVDACKTANEMWIAIERLQQGKSLSIQDVKTNLFWEFRKFTSRDRESIESYYSRFYNMMNEMIRNNLQVATMQYQNEVNEIRAERIAKSANPLAFVAAAQQYPETYHKAPKSQRSYAPAPKQSFSTRSNASARHKGKEIAKLVTPPSESDSDEDIDPEQAQKDKEMQKKLALIAKYFKKLYKPTNNNLRTSSNSRHKTVDTVPRYLGTLLRNVENERGLKTTLIIRKRCCCANKLRKEVLPADSDINAEPLAEVQYDDEYNVFANEKRYSEQPEHINDTHVLEKNDSNVTLDSSNMCNNDNQVDQNATECDDERVALVNLISNLKLDVDENKKIHKQLKKANASLTQEL